MKFHKNCICLAFSGRLSRPTNNWSSMKELICLIDQREHKSILQIVTLDKPIDRAELNKYESYLFKENQNKEVIFSVRR